MRGKANNQNSRLMRIITIPIRVLVKAKDFYVKSMNDCANSASYGNIMGLPAAVPRSFSVSSSRSSHYDTEDLRELIRSASARTSIGRNNNNSDNNNNNFNTRSSSMTVDLYMKQQQQQMRPSSGAMGSRRVPRSCSVGMGKIDEDLPCDFFGDEDLGSNSTTVNVKSSTTEFMYPRSKSYAVAKRNVVF